MGQNALCPRHPCAARAAQKRRRAKAGKAAGMSGLIGIDIAAPAGTAASASVMQAGFARGKGACALYFSIMSESMSASSSGDSLQPPCSHKKKTLYMPPAWKCAL